MTMETEDQKIFFDVWNKSQKNQKLTKFEKPFKKIIDSHPMYHDFLSNPDQTEILEDDPTAFDPNLHLALHAILAEMIREDSPPGIRKIYDQLIHLESDKHEVQHKIMSIYFDWLVESVRGDGADVNLESFLKQVSELLEEETLGT